MFLNVTRVRWPHQSHRLALLSIGLLAAAGCVADHSASEHTAAESDAPPRVLAQVSSCRPGEPEVSACGVDMATLEGGKTRVSIGGKTQLVSYKLIGTGNRQLIMQSDIDLGYEGGGRSATVQSAIGVTEIGRRWPNGRIPYEFDKTLKVGDRVLTAMRAWESATPIRFVPHTNEDAFVKFWPAMGYSSAVGRVGHEQAVNLKSDPAVGSIIHELGHTIGLFHEQSRGDRDQYVRIDLANVWQDKHDDFEKLAGIIGVSDFGPYDFESIMHYPWNAFAIEETLPTIALVPGVSLPAGVTYETMGQRTMPSAGDIEAVNKMYAQ